MRQCMVCCGCLRAQHPTKCNSFCSELRGHLTGCSSVAGVCAYPAQSAALVRALSNLMLVLLLHRACVCFGQVAFADPCAHVVQAASLRASIDCSWLLQAAQTPLTSTSCPQNLDVRRAAVGGLCCVSSACAAGRQYASSSLFCCYRTRRIVTLDVSSDRACMPLLHAQQVFSQHANAWPNCTVSGCRQILNARGIACDCCWLTMLFVASMYVHHRTYSCCHLTAAIHLDGWMHVRRKGAFGSGWAGGLLIRVGCVCSCI